MHGTNTSVNKDNMFKSLTLIGFCAACVLSLGLAILFTNSGEAGPDNAKAHMAMSANCPVVDVAVDEGYGVSRMEKRHQCKDLSH